MHIAYSENLSLGADEWISLSKPAKVFARCFDKSRDTVVAVQPITPDQVALAHDKHWAMNVLDCREQNGFGDTRNEVIQQVLYANGALLRAAEVALLVGVGYAPVSGFHHAGYDFNGGFCTFNGLIITLQVLKAAGKIKSALILDFDGHYGNGTADIINRLNLDWMVIPPEISGS
jgi:acetoin utilization deacetylase AcuC-like enzyme